MTIDQAARSQNQVPRIGTPGESPARRILAELFFSFYLPALVVAAHERDPGGPWAARLLRWGVSAGYLPNHSGLEDHRIFYWDFLLVWCIALVLFLFLRAVRNHLQENHLFMAIGILVLTAYPLALIYIQMGVSVFLYLEAVLSVIAYVLWLKAKRSVSTAAACVLLGIHFIVWSTLGGGSSLSRAAWTAVWPGLYTRPGASGPFTSFFWLCYPIIGFALAVLVGICLRESMRKDRPASGA
ncbi:MAG TPA: hypothetical protein VMU05_09900 [Dongiaceae bacterium]|nr:hypothetical protein [Dongiaceae bacterium]